MSVPTTSAATARGLIYDVGMHNGDDTAYYLQHAARVVAIEANPVMASQGSERFAREIADGRLTVLNVAIAEQSGAAEFWICDDVSVWSSFDRSIASRDGSRHHPIEITCRDFADILAEHGTPDYCKIDIEGNDHVCLEGLRNRERPAYISLEMSHERGDRDLRLLAELGYTRFKIINQETFRPVNRLLARAVGAVPWADKHVRRVQRKTISIRSHGSWRFPDGSSGPFGEQTPGKWRSLQEALDLWYALHLLEQRLRGKELAGWFDIHATT